MSTFVKGGSIGTPFGRNEFLRSVRDIKTESYTVSGLSVPARTIDGVAGQKILQPGTIMAKITAGTASEIGKIGPWTLEVANADGRKTPANIVGICMTFLPWQLIERDVEVSVVYECSAVQAWCLEMPANASAIPVALSNATAAFMQKQSPTNTGNVGVDITWR